MKQAMNGQNAKRRSGRGVEERTTLTLETKQNHKQVSARGAGALAGGNCSVSDFLHVIVTLGMGGKNH